MNASTPCKMSGKSIKPQLPMTEVNYLPPAEKLNQEIQLDFNGPISFKHRRFYILISIDRYSRWPAAYICEAPTSKTNKQQKSFWNNMFYSTEFHKQLEQIKGQPSLEENSDKCVKN